MSKLPCSIPESGCDELLSREATPKGPEMISKGFTKTEHMGTENNSLGGFEGFLEKALRSEARQSKGVSW